MRNYDFFLVYHGVQAMDSQFTNKKQFFLILKQDEIGMSGEKQNEIHEIN